MSKQTTLAEGINPVGTELIGKIVYFEACLEAAVMNCPGLETWQDIVQAVMA